MLRKTDTTQKRKGDPMTVSQTSLLAYHDPMKKKERMTNKERIFVFIAMNPDTTQPKIQREFRMKPNCVSPRVKELKDEGRVIVTGTVHEELAEGHLVEKYRAVTA